MPYIYHCPFCPFALFHSLFRSSSSLFAFVFFFFFNFVKDIWRINTLFWVWTGVSCAFGMKCTHILKESVVMRKSSSGSRWIDFLMEVRSVGAHLPKLLITKRPQSLDSRNDRVQSPIALYSLPVREWEESPLSKTGLR